MKNKKYQVEIRDYITKHKKLRMSEQINYLNLIRWQNQCTIKKLAINNKIKHIVE